MSALAHKRTMKHVRAMSAFTERTLVERVAIPALFQQETRASQQMACLFEQLVGVGKQRGRHSEAQCFRSLEIDDELKSSGKLYR